MKLQKDKQVKKLKSSLNWNQQSKILSTNPKTRTMLKMANKQLNTHLETKGIENQSTKAIMGYDQSLRLLQNGQENDSDLSSVLEERMGDYYLRCKKVS